jgi:hypothetical protein
MMPHVPDVTYKAIGHGREVNLASLGVPAVLIFVARETSSQARPIAQAIREHFPTIDQLVICNVADVRGIPKLVRKPVEMLMKSSYKDAVDNLEPGRAPEDYVLILPDWDSDAFTALEVDDVKQHVSVIVVDSTGEKRGAFTDAESAVTALKQLPAPA